MDHTLENTLEDTNNSKNNPIQINQYETPSRLGDGPIKYSLSEYSDTVHFANKESEMSNSTNLDAKPSMEHSTGNSISPDSDPIMDPGASNSMAPNSSLSMSFSTNLNTSMTAPAKSNQSSPIDKRELGVIKVLTPYLVKDESKPDPRPIQPTPLDVVRIVIPNQVSGPIDYFNILKNDDYDQENILYDVNEDIIDEHKYKDKHKIDYDLYDDKNMNYRLDRRNNKVGEFTNRMRCNNPNNGM
eukprot:GHVP01054276.1.p1 GENE.GHVP01054276.1~~GHVP01054276.1.p1  ORF type:complete len:243 (+),score=21.66 GHVP01054276.1:100-828(+)